MSPSGNFGAAKSSGKTGIRRQGSLMRDTANNFNREETRINFFNSHTKDIGLYDIDQKPEEEKILETRIDPLEWKQEIDRVYRDLVNIEKEIEVMKS